MHTAAIAIIWLIIPLCNFFGWAYYAQTRRSSKLCVSQGATGKTRLYTSKTVSNTGEVGQTCVSGPDAANTCRGYAPLNTAPISISFEDAKEFDKYRSKHMATFETPLDKLLPPDLQVSIMNTYPGTQCTTHRQVFMAMNSQTNCFAVASVGHTNDTMNILRFDSDVDFYGISKKQATQKQYDKFLPVYTQNNHSVNTLPTAGYFRKIPLEKGFVRLKEKLGGLLDMFSDLTAQLDEKLTSFKIERGDDVVVMVVNEGEIDLFLNFACSCRLHNISLTKLMVFCASSEIVSIVESTGAMALYHSAYGTVSRKASADYLDRVFVDMMWYKCFSTYLLLRRGINILFQDVDMLWFRNPFEYFHNYLDKFADEFQKTGSSIEVFFSDDGQRSMRYTPFYANSGFYYMVASPRSEYFAWSIMIAFDSIQRLGSHQNVVTTRLLEGISLSHRHVKILSMEDFPNGILYHHQPAYMKAMRAKTVHPYIFHMCWTQGKDEKLEYLYKSKLWYVTEQCSSITSLTRDDSPNRKGSTKSMFSKSNFVIPSNASAPHGESYEFIVNELKSVGITEIDAPSGDSRYRFSGLNNQVDQQKMVNTVWGHLADRCCTFMPGSP